MTGIERGLTENRIRLSYNDVHKAIQSTAVKIKDQFSQSRVGFFTPRDPVQVEC